MTFKLSSTAIIRRKMRGKRHIDGTCGYMGSLCPACHKEEQDEMVTWAENVSILPRQSGESETDWYIRNGGRMLDCWPAALDTLKKRAN